MLDLAKDVFAVLGFISMLGGMGFAFWAFVVDPPRPMPATDEEDWFHD